MIGLLRTNRTPLAIISGAAFLVCAYWIITSGRDNLPPIPAGRLVAVAACSMGLYLCSHLLRAIRIAVIGITFQNTSFRTLVLMNLTLAPWSMIAPFKLDELIRLNELHSICQSWPRAATTIIIDRAMDGPVLLLFAIALYFHGDQTIALYAGVFGIALVAVTGGFFAAAQILHLVQGYMFVYHSQPLALRILHRIHNLRLLAELGRETIARAAPILLICTIGIWSLEISAVGLLLWTFPLLPHGPLDLVSATLVRANLGWRALLTGQQLGFPAGFISEVFASGLLLIWPAAVLSYCSRRALETRNVRFTYRPIGIGAGQEGA